MYNSYENLTYDAGFTAKKMEMSKSRLVAARGCKSSPLTPGVVSWPMPSHTAALTSPQRTPEGQWGLFLQATEESELPGALTESPLGSLMAMAGQGSR